MKMEEVCVGKSLYKLEFICIKIIPYIIALCYICNTISSYIYKELPIFSFIGSLSILPMLFLYLSSFVFRFCIYHRLPLYYCFISDCISLYDLYVGIPISNRNLFALNMMILGIFILLLVYFKFKQHESRTSK